MSLIGNNLKENTKKHKITTLNLDVTSSSSSDNESVESNNNKDNKQPSTKIINLFSDNDSNDEDNENREKEEDLTYGFERALNKKQFEGEKGKLLLQLQNSYVNDKRFILNSTFKDDINYKKLPSYLKESKNANNFEYEEIDPEAEDENIELEKKRNMSILAEILPNSAFLEHKSIDKPTNKLIIKRFDPGLQLGGAGVEAIKNEKKSKNNNGGVEKNEKNFVKLEKGVQIFNDKNDMELYNKYNDKYNDINKMKKKEKEKLISDTINRINDDMNQEIKVNYDSWKKGILEKVDNNFSLFGNNTNNISNMSNDDTKVVEKKVENEGGGEENEEELLKKKKRREKNKLRKKEKRRLKKEKEKIKKEKIRKKMEEIDKKYQEELIKEHGEDKANKYLQYIEMIKDKKNHHKKKK